MTVLLLKCLPHFASQVGGRGSPSRCPAGERWCPCPLRRHRLHPGNLTCVLTLSRPVTRPLPQEYTKRPRQSSDAEQKRYHPRHVVHPSSLTLQECLAISDVVVSAVPSASYKVKTEWLKDGCICLNVAADKNFEKDVRDKVS